jgi:hypothetical protein
MLEAMKVFAIVLVFVAVAACSEQKANTGAVTSTWVRKPSSFG